jgi:hypothetical protein
MIAFAVLAANIAATQAPRHSWRAFLALWWHLRMVFPLCSGSGVACISINVPNFHSSDQQNYVFFARILV